MSIQITTAFVNQFNAEVFHLSQQKGSRLQGLVRRETQAGEKQFYDILGAAVAKKRLVRHADTPRMDSKHSRRMVTLSDYDWADLLDKPDLDRMLANPVGDYALSAMWAMGRAKDDVVIEAADGVAYAGKEGTSAVVMPNIQKLAAITGAGAFTDMNVALLRKVKKKFDGNDVDESILRHAAVTSAQVESMLNETEITSADFNTVRALVMGEVNSFMGFDFTRIERLNTQVDALLAEVNTGVVGTGTTVVGHRKALFWAHDGILMATSQDVNTKIDELPTKSYSTQVYVTMGVGGTRMEEKKVVVGLCKEA
jgi:hypothetical protein